MNDSTLFLSTRDHTPIIKIQIAGVEVNLRVFFSVNCYEFMIENHQQGDDYRTAFAKAVFHMYQQTAETSQNMFTEDDFIGLPDQALTSVLGEILQQENKVKAEYDKIKADNPYERFYKAQECILESVVLDVSEALGEIPKTIDSMKKISNKFFEDALGDFTPPGIPQTSIPPANFAQLQAALKNMPKTQFPELTAAISNIPNPYFDLKSILSPLDHMLKEIEKTKAAFAKSIKNPFLQLEKSIQDLKDSIDFSLLIYRKEWSKGRDVLLSYDWFYSSEIPEEIVNKIYENQAAWSKDEVDEIIVAYFRENRCEALKKLVHSWSQLPYFACRKEIFHQALVNHSRKYFNVSVTLLVIHTEGVITDFVRNAFPKPRYRATQAIKDVKQKLVENEDISVYDDDVFNDVIERISEAFTERFDCANPDGASNRSRDKIAHGHVYEKETEVNSLKNFLYLNEIYHLFCILEQLQ